MVSSLRCVVLEMTLILCPITIAGPAVLICAVDMADGSRYERSENFFDMCISYVRFFTCAQRSSISRDAPTYFNNPTVQYKTEVPPPGRKATITRATNRVFVENESAYVLPGGKSILSATQMIKAANTMYSRRQLSRQYPHGNQVLFHSIDELLLLLLRIGLLHCWFSILNCELCAV